MENKRFIFLAKTALILVYMVFLAGATVRMTGSGMGCPDWPKCFGYYIPPTEIEQLLWQPNHNYQKGQVIIHEKKLWVAKDDFTTNDVYDLNHWEAYTKHNYAEFNVYHTWTEYINRLFGALAGLGCLVMFIASFSYWKTRKSVVFAAFLSLFLLGFNAWLGAKVVYSVLNPVKITTHMVAALFNVAALILTIYLASNKKKNTIYDKSFQLIAIFTMTVSIVQIALGTQVRQFIDEQTLSGVSNVAEWLQNPNDYFYLHRTFSYVIILTSLFLFLRNKNRQLGHNFKINWILILITLEIITGIMMYYIHFPLGSQALHLLLASILFGLQFSLIFDSKKQE